MRRLFLKTETTRPQTIDRSLRPQLAYALPTAATAFLIGPLAIVQGIYAKYFGLPLTTIATVLLAARIFDAVTDPLIGYGADRYYRRYGSRKPFVAVGGLLLVVSGYFLYVPVDWATLAALEQGETGVRVSTGYFVGWFLLFYLAWTLFEIPHLAWASDLTTRATAKSRIYSLRYAATTMGLLGFYAIPLLPVFNSNEFTPTTLSVAVLLAAVAMLPLLYLCLKNTPSGAAPGRENPPLQQVPAKGDLRGLVGEIPGNKPLILFLLALALVSIGVPGMWFTLIFIYADAYLKLGEHFALASLISPCVGLLFLGVWYRLAARWGKQAVLALAMLCSAAGLLITGGLTPETSGFAGLLLVMTLCYGLGATANGALSPSLLADIIDYHRWKFGHDRTATCFALYALVSKGALALGGALGLSIAGYYGFDPSVATHSDHSIQGLRWAIAWLPAGLSVSAALLFWFNPMTTQRHALIRRRLEAQNRRRVSADAVSVFDDIQVVRP